MPRNQSRSRSRDWSRTPEKDRSLPCGTSPISESDYFQKSDEFRLWLKEEKRKYFDELSGERARSYFRKFVKVWNKGKLSKKFYEGIDPATIAATSQTAYKWSFASKSNRADEVALRNAREEVAAATRKKESLLQGSSSQPSTGGGRVLGPTLPSTSDLTVAREYASELQEEQRLLKRKRDKAETKDRIEDMVGPREVGREGALEKKRVKRENDRAFREKGDDGFEADESTLLGGGDSFKDYIARRDASKKKYNKKSEEREVVQRERASAFKEKEKATMDMLQQLAKRFG